jgi:hypothetical protein
MTSKAFKAQSIRKSLNRLMDNCVDGEFYELEEEIKNVSFQFVDFYQISALKNRKAQKLISLMEKAYAASHSIMTFHMRLTYLYVGVKAFFRLQIMSGTNCRAAFVLLHEKAIPTT